MNNLNLVKKEGQLMADSRDVAMMVDKKHPHLLRDIENYVDVIGESNFGSADYNAPNLGAAEFFVESKYIDGQGKERKHYYITRKGCELIANKLTGKKGIMFTAVYVTKFEEMEKQLYHDKKLPTNYKEALIALVEAEEEKEQKIKLIQQKEIEVKDLKRRQGQIADKQTASALAHASVLSRQLKALQKKFESITFNIINDKEYVAQQIAVDFGIMSMNHKPHSAVVNEILLPLDLNYDRSWKTKKVDLYTGKYFKEINIQTITNAFVKDWVYNVHAYEFFKTYGMAYLKSCEYVGKYRQINGQSRKYNFYLESDVVIRRGHDGKFYKYNTVLERNV